MRSRVYITVEVRAFVCLQSVHLSVRPIDRQQQRLAVGLLLSALVAGDINRLLHGAVQQALALSSKCRYTVALITDAGD